MPAPSQKSNGASTPIATYAEQTLKDVQRGPRPKIDQESFNWLKQKQSTPLQVIENDREKWKRIVDDEIAANEQKWSVFVKKRATSRGSGS